MSTKSFWDLVLIWEQEASEVTFLGTHRILDLQVLQRKGERSRNKHWEINTQACNVNRCIWSARCIHPQKTTPQQGMVSYSSPKPSNLQKSETSTLRNGFSSSPYIIPPIKTRRGSLFINLTFPGLLPPPPPPPQHTFNHLISL